MKTMIDVQENIKNAYLSNYKDKIDTKRLDELINVEDYNIKIQEIDDKLGDKKVKLYTLEVDYKNIEPKLENLSNIEEKLVNNKEKMVNLKNLEESMILAKEVLSSRYETI